MTHAEFVVGYHSRLVRHHVSGWRAALLLMRSQLVPETTRLDYRLLGGVVAALVLGGALAVAWPRWWPGLGLVVLGVSVGANALHAAARRALALALESEAFHAELERARAIARQPAAWPLAVDRIRFNRPRVATATAGRSGR